MYQEIKKLADEALALQNKLQMENALRTISSICEGAPVVYGTAKSYDSEAEMIANEARQAKLIREAAAEVAQHEAGSVSAVHRRGAMASVLLAAMRTARPRNRTANELCESATSHSRLDTDRDGNHADGPRDHG